MNPFEMVVVIVAIVMFASVLKSVFRGPRHPVVFNNEGDKAETMRLRDELARYKSSNAQLEQRVRVLEQIVTDGGAQTAAQIEALRDKDRIGNGDKVQ